MEDALGQPWNSQMQPCEAAWGLPHLCRDRFHHLLDTNDIQYTC
jgi:hypothetical protein